jgi:hypothetical protein
MPLNQILFNRMKIDKINLYIGLLQNKIKTITDETDAIQITLQALPIEPIVLKMIIADPVILVDDPMIIVEEPTIIEMCIPIDLEVIAEQSDISSDDDIELTDISEEEIKQREAEETRMQEELSRLQLEKLLKKKVRAKK